jgi:hypothetical protein
MDLRVDSRLEFPRDVVFRAYRDEMPALVPYLPNVRAIDVVSREEDGDVVRIVNVWHGGGEIPRAAHAVLNERMLSWTDRATWRESDKSCAWKIETHAFTEAVHCEGTSRFLEDGPGATLLEMRGTITIDAKAIHGVPRFLASGVARTVEDFLGKRIEPNLRDLAVGLGRYLAQRSKTV